MIHVDGINRKMGNGSTDPLLGELGGSISCKAVLKTKDNPQSLLALVNELICFRLARIINLPIPDSGVAIIDDRTTVESSGLLTLADT